jgi:hypothetical protein
VNGGNKRMKRDRNCTVLESDCPEKKEEVMRKLRLAIKRRPALAYPWAALYNLISPQTLPGSTSRQMTRSAASKASIFGNVQIDISILKETETKGIIFIFRFYSTSFINA